MTYSQITAKPGSLRTWLDYLNSINPDHMELGLDRVRAVLQRLNLSFYKNIPVIEVAGTNGKGSTAALIAGSVNASNLKAGLYTSPHLHRFNERINIGGTDVSDEMLCKALSLVYDAALNSKDGRINLTYFEYTTLAAFVCFDMAKVDVAVLEIGLGGRLDAVNVLDASVSVITSIGLDHTHILGDTIEKIAHEKAGIIKDGSVVVVGRLPAEAKVAVKKCVLEHKATLFAEGEDFSCEVSDSIKYTEKTEKNVLTFNLPYPKIPLICVPAAIRTLRVLINMGVNITSEGIKKAIKTVALPGRMQLVSLNPLIYLDVAHNPPAAANLVKTLASRAKLAKRYAVIGMLKDKDIESVIKIIAESFDGFYVSSLHTLRGENSQRLLSALKCANVDESLVKSYNHVKDALKAAISDSAQNDEIIVLGSFVTVSEAMEELKI